MIVKDYRKEFETLAKAYEKAGGDVSKFLDRRIASIIISGDKVIGLNGVEGVELTPHRIENGVQVDMRIKEGVVVEYPVHVCTGYLEKKGLQRVVFNIRLEKNAKAIFVAHCVFPWTEDFTHDALMNVELEEGAWMEYHDEHMHSETGSINLITRSIARVGEGAVYRNTFTLVKTRIGTLRVFMDASLEKDAVGELYTKVKAIEDDDVEVKEILRLNGMGARGLAKTNAVAIDRAKVSVVNEVYGNAPHTRGHVECLEIAKGDGVDVRALPVLVVKNDSSELTHEASIGRVNAKQLETLMAKGLTEEEATEMIIKGILT
ncbi:MULTISPECIES: SufB/SufD family protein [Thermotoga]|jgi:Fe-S cluster assembly scaffold protein SufB|uniref:SufBD protein n=1 Tax=Thermotoga petrophila (strain ATCC BAA-489 / DSM 13996 / JCM 10882 / RKU-10) TaxID=590168 RepID=D2C423_THEP2|nr:MULTISPECIES: SufD family Fe-S cluster assembly protein [Thermotoga]MBZ4662102.1 SufBD protein [Thermotoga sp.]ACB09653.1 SufBD protein [Thermotoga sp. RQ2]ADA67477.1 SufBD protein [Thermotoga petrophila RKU-10]AIY88701.1 SufBD protein [Thermotoga sp. Cell2]KHC93908.1 SufBD protein [Thermotoga sp. TBGT1765]